MASRRGKLAGAIWRSSWMPNHARATPSAVPPPASTSASASIWRTRRHQLPPNAVRTASSRSRSETRTSIRLATLAQAISSRKITAPISARMAGRTALTRCALHGLQAYVEVGGAGDVVDFLFGDGSGLGLRLGAFQRDPVL